jgi:hypothetical protein
MPRKKTGSASQAVTPEELTLWTRRFATMIAVGVSLVRCLHVLEQEPTSGAMREVTRKMRAAIENGEMLSEAMAKRPDVFDPDYIGSVRTGEIGGILDRTMLRSADWREKGFGVRRAMANDEVSRAELAEWCWRFGHMLNAGVPLLAALAALAWPPHSPLRDVPLGDALRALPPPADGPVRSPLARTTFELREEVRCGCLLSEPMQQHVALFTPMLVQMIQSGEASGTLEQMLKEAATQFEYEAKLESEGKLPPLQAKITQAKAHERPGYAREEHPVVRRVNGVISSALEREAESLEISPTAENKGQATLSKKSKVIGEMPLEDYDRVVRRLKLMANIDLFAQVDRRGRIQIRWEGKGFEADVWSHPQPGGDHLRLWIRPMKSVEMGGQ